MRFAVALAALLAAAPALAGRRASFRVGAEVVSSARMAASFSAGALGVESRSFGGAGAAVLLEQRSGAPLCLRDGSRIPPEGQRPLVVLAGASGRLALASFRGAAEVVVTLFPDGAPPRN
ncbi:MAG TPA: hypothetical protein VKC58_15570 [Myxococcales bacterium]|jgi:hypothetical protein|nr:hypothetical protein [Myxococcales bacterium]